MKIVTTKQSPAYTPDTAWIAVDDQTYDGPGSPLGSGATEIEAILDLLDRLVPATAPISPHVEDLR